VPACCLRRCSCCSDDWARAAVLATHFTHTSLPPSLRPPPCLNTPQEFTSKEIRWKAEALMAMQEAAEYYLVGLFEDA
jgi:hypothetical protein